MTGAPPADVVCTGAQVLAAEGRAAVAVGRLADLTILDRDPFAVDPAGIADIRVLRTVVGGRAVSGPCRDVA